MIYPILKFGEDVLRQKAAPVAEVPLRHTWFPAYS